MNFKSNEHVLFIYIYMTYQQIEMIFSKHKIIYSIEFTAHIIHVYYTLYRWYGIIIL